MTNETTPTDDDGSTVTRRQAMAAPMVLLLPNLFDGWDLIAEEPESAMVAVDEADERGDYDADEFDAFLARDTGALYRPDEEAGGWTLITTTGESPELKQLIVEDLRTKNIGVSANQSQDITVDSGSANETRIALDDVEEPYFDDFGELDADANEFVIKHGSHHKIDAHAFLQTAASTGQVRLRIYVNGQQRGGIGTGTTTTGKDMSAYTSAYLKLNEGDRVYATVEHDTGSTETFPGDEGNYVSCVRQ